MFDKEIVEKAKKENVEVYYGEIRFADKAGAAHSAAFLFRKPLVADIEVYQRTAQKSPYVSNENLLRSLIVHPQVDEVMVQVRDFPIAVDSFVGSEIVPFFGASVQTASQKV